MRTFLFLCFLNLCFSLSLYGQSSNSEYYISGNLKLDSIWNQEIYLSHIPSFSKMYTMSKSMIIAESKIDTLGNFKFNIDYLPKEDNLYRLHISKKTSSKASLIIGGKDENHFFIVANNRSKINIKNQDTLSLFSKITIKGSKQNSILQEVDGIVRYIDSTSFNESQIKSEFVAKALQEKLRVIADTCRFPLASLYALNKSKFESNLSINEQFYKDYLNKWKNNQSVYFKSFRKKVHIKKTKSNTMLWLFSAFAFVLGMLFNYYFFSFIKKTKNSDKLKSLSIQERKIFIMIQNGKSNKEISEEFNIGVSTVKSHVSNIYSKLGVKSRKEAINIK